MVRQKARWFLVRVEFPSDMSHDNDNGGRSHLVESLIRQQQQRTTTNRVRTESGGTWASHRSSNDDDNNNINNNGIQPAATAAAVDATMSWTRLDFYPVLRDHLSQYVGDTAPGILADTKVRFWDSATRLVMIKTARETYSELHACLCVIVNMKGSRVAFRIVSVHGCARTIKKHSIQQVKQQYREAIRKELQSTTTKNRQNKAWQDLISMICQSFHDTLDVIATLDF